MNGFPKKQGLYDPAFEKDSCGVGFVMNMRGEKSHEIIFQGLEILKKMDLLKNDETPVSKDLLKQIVDMLYGTIWSRTEQLSLQERSMITLTVLVEC